MSARVFITGLGAISAIGNNVTEMHRSLRNGISGIGKIDILKTVHRDEIPAGEIKLTNEQLTGIAGLPKNGYFTRVTLLGLIAAKEAISQSGCHDTNCRTGFVSATSVGGMDKTEQVYHDYIDPGKSGDFTKYINTHDCGDSTELMADHLGIKDFVTTISTACSSSANSIMFGARLIKHGHLDRVIAGGVDCLSLFTLNGFNSLLILDKETCKPFDQNRKGLNLGEGAGFVVLESEKIVKKHRKKVLCELVGFANTNDAYHQTASSPNGDGAFAAMEKAIQKSGMKTTDLDYINVHGTATDNNDLSEGKALRRIFNDNVPWFSSTKAFTGHTLAAAGAIEAVISILAILNGEIFPNINFKTPMEETGLIPQTSFIENQTVNNVMSNSFGFGGNNTVLIFSKHNG